MHWEQYWDEWWPRWKKRVVRKELKILLKRRWFYKQKKEYKK